MSEIFAISGHRVYSDPGALYRGLDNLSAKEYVFGGARGLDTDALEYIAKTQPHSIRTVVVPNRLIDQPKYTIPITKQYATEIIELKNTGLDRFQIRNRFIVDRSTHLRAFYDFRGSGGTYNTIEYAKSSGKSYSIWPVEKYNAQDFLDLSEERFESWMEKMQSSQVPLSAFKGIIMTYYGQKLGYIPAKVIIRLGTWKLKVYW